MPDVIPFLTYEDGIAALEWLAEAFGFTEIARFTTSDGRLSHGEMSVGDCRASDQPGQNALANKGDFHSSGGLV